MMRRAFTLLACALALLGVVSGCARWASRTAPPSAPDGTPARGTFEVTPDPAEGSPLRHPA